LGVTALLRVADVVRDNWTTYSGELFINFPALIALD